MDKLDKAQREIIKWLHEKQLERKQAKMDKIKAVWNWLEGKKTYITAVVIAVCVLLQASGVNVPEEVYVLLTALLGVNIRLAVTKK